MSTPVDVAMAQQITDAISAGEPIGWQVVDADGNVVDSGPVTFAEMTSEMAEQLGLDSPEEN